MDYVVEFCPHCETEVSMEWDVETYGYKAYCPYCGKRLMLCSECGGDCDYENDRCRYNGGDPE